MSEYNEMFKHVRGDEIEIWSTEEGKFIKSSKFKTDVLLNYEPYKVDEGWWCVEPDCFAHNPYSNNRICWRCGGGVSPAHEDVILLRGVVGSQLAVIGWLGKRWYFDIMKAHLRNLIDKDECVKIIDLPSVVNELLIKIVRKEV